MTGETILPQSGEVIEAGTPRPSRLERRQRVRKRLARLALALLFLALVLCGSALSVSTLGRSAYRWHGFEIELRLLPSRWGTTTLRLAPLGAIHAHTHLAPVALVASLEELQIEEINKLLKTTPTKDELATDFEREARKDLRLFITWQLLMGALGGLLAPLLFHSRRLRVHLFGGGLGALAVALLLFNILHTFDRSAFNSLTYTGALKQAPWVIQFGKDAFTKIEALSTKLRTVAANLNVLYGRIASAPGDPAENGPDIVRILHISDLHNNVTALNFVRQVASEFKVQMIVDTGDLTDFGSPAELPIMQAMGRLPYPYVFVLGNHDSQTVAKTLAGFPNVTQLNGAAEVNGIRFLGLPNPAAARQGVGSVDAPPAMLQAGADRLLEAINTMPTPPDIVAVHDPTEAARLVGRVPLILCGHTHAYRIDQEMGAQPFQTIWCNAGTTGAAGGRYFENPRGVPFSCAVLTFRRQGIGNRGQDIEKPPVFDAQGVINPAPGTRNPEPLTLRAIDMIVLNGALNQYSIDHRTFSAEAAVVLPPPAVRP